MDLEDVWLSNLKFAAAPSVPKPPASINATFTQQEFKHAQSASSLASSGFGRPKLHENLVPETIGEDLAPDAGIWQLYLDEAKEHDEELVKGQNGNLDMMLLFAALFSAILSAFLIESKNLLQQDPVDVSVALLLVIAQSQQRIEQGTPQTGSAPIELPSFSASLSARWINGLWFLSLAFSLSAALIAMLAKEWLTMFITSRPRAPHGYALLHQARLVGLTGWRALHVIDLLPSMLHLSLLLFSSGLVLYLWTLDTVIASAIAGITGFTLVFYITTAFIGAIYEFCPFVTQISKYIHEILKIYAKDWMKQRRHIKTDVKPLSDCTTDEELRALTWLANHARDPAVDNHTQPDNRGSWAPAWVHATSTLRDGEQVNTSKANAKSEYSNNQCKLLRGLLDGLCTRLSQSLTHSPRELAMRQGSNVARYACALPEIVERLQVYHDKQTFNEGKKAKYAQLVSTPPAQATFIAMDTIWSNDCPALSPDSYALLTSAELRLVVVAVAAHPHLDLTRPTVLETKGARSHLNSHTLSREAYDTTESYVEVTFDLMKETLSQPAVHLPDLQARYSRALSRAAYLLRYHGDGRAHINASALIYLLESIHAAAMHHQLNPESRLSTHHPQSAPGYAPVIYVRVIGFEIHWMYPENLGGIDGLLVGLLRLLDPAEVQSPPALERAIAGALGAIAPILLKQWLKVTLPHGARKESEHGELSADFLAIWLLIKDSDSVDRVKVILTRQVIGIAIFAVSHAGCPGIGELPEQAMLALYRRFKVAPGHFEAADRSSLGAGMDRLVCSVDFNSERLSENVFKSLTSIFLLKHEQRTFFQFPGISPESTPPFLRVLSKVPGQISELQILISALADNVQTSTWCLQVFTDAEDGFSALLMIGEHDEYRSIVANCVKIIIEYTVNRSSDIVIGARAVLGTFGAVAFALKALASDEEGTANLLASTGKIFPPSLHALQPATMHHIMTSAVAADLHFTLQSMDEESEARECLLAVLVDILGWWHLDCVPVEGLGPLFEPGLGLQDDFQDDRPFLNT